MVMAMMVVVVVRGTCRYGRKIYLRRTGRNRSCGRAMARIREGKIKGGAGAGWKLERWRGCEEQIDDVGERKRIVALHTRVSLNTRSSIRAATTETAGRRRAHYVPSIRRREALRKIGAEMQRQDDGGERERKTCSRASAISIPRGTRDSAAWRARSSANPPSPSQLWKRRHARRRRFARSVPGKRDWFPPPF